MMFRPPRPHRPKRSPLNLPPRKVLATANSFYARGQPDMAAPLFVQLAGKMEADGKPGRAANLHARAAHAYADARNEELAVAEARAALTQFLQLDLPERPAIFLRNIIQKLKSRGMPAAADRLVEEFRDRVEILPATRPLPMGIRKAVLPPQCPSCGAPVLGPEVEWIDAASARCSYCGSLIAPDS
jgi:hypothetical protein